MTLHCDEYYIQYICAHDRRDAARQARVTRLKNRKGPVVQMGLSAFTLGERCKGDWQSAHKIDATLCVSEAVERAEFSESSTKLYYGLNM